MDAHSKKKRCRSRFHLVDESSKRRPPGQKWDQLSGSNRSTDSSSTTCVGPSTSLSSTSLPPASTGSLLTPLTHFTDIFNARRQFCIEHCVLDPRSNRPTEHAHRLLWSAAIRHMTVMPRTVFAWAVPTAEALQCVKRYCRGGVVEMGAGTGLWARCLIDSGVHPVIPYDAHPLRQDTLAHMQALGGDVAFHHAELDTKDFHWAGNYPSFVTVHRARPSVLAHHPHLALLLCWPPPHPSSMAYQCLKHYRGDMLVYVGEFPGHSEHSSTGLNGSARFHQRLSEQWVLVDSVELPRFPYCTDRLTVWRRKEQGKGGGDGTRPTSDSRCGVGCEGDEAITDEHNAKSAEEGGQCASPHRKLHGGAGNSDTTEDDEQEVGQEQEEETDGEEGGGQAVGPVGASRAMTVSDSPVHEMGLCECVCSDRWPEDEAFKLRCACLDAEETAFRRHWTSLERTLLDP